MAEQKFVSYSLAELQRLGARIIPLEETAALTSENTPAAPPSTPLRPRPGSHDPFIGQINEAEARRLGLERVEVEGNPAAQDCIARIFDQTRTDKFDILNTDNIKSSSAIHQFVTAWQQAAPNIPVPCVAGQYENYIKRLAEGNIISNLDVNNKKISPPRFEKSSVLWMEDWNEGNWDETTFKKTTSPLLTELGVKQNDGKLATGVVDISRIAVDAALWIGGDPLSKIKTQKHTALITKLGLDPAHFNFRLIRQDEYARLRGAGKNFGNSNLWTWFDDYWVGGAGVRGLHGGHRGRGGASYVGYDSRDDAGGSLAVRLVLECTRVAK